MKSLEEILREKALKKLMERRQKLSEVAKESGEKVETSEEVQKVDGKTGEEESKEKPVEETKETPSEDSKACVADEKSPEIKESSNKAVSPRKRVLAVAALKSVIGRTVTEGSVVDDKPGSPPPPAANDEIRVKSFEEIMKEKKLRRNQLGKQKKELGNCCLGVDLVIIIKREGQNPQFWKEGVGGFLVQKMF